MYRNFGTSMVKIKYGQILSVIIFIWICFLKNTISEKVPAISLPYNCAPELEPGECRWSNWTRSCFWFQTDVASNVDNITAELAAQGCKIPKTEFGNVVLQRRMEFIFSTTIIKRLANPSKPCGGCSFRLRCCRKSPNFLYQSIDALQCTRGSFSKACVVPGLTAEELEVNRQNHADWPHTSDDMCDFNQFIPLHLIPGNDSSSLLMQSLLCSFYGNSQPIITCTKLSKQRCQCCCNGFVPSSDGFCIPDPTPRPDPLCAREDTEPDKCVWKQRTQL